MPGKSSIQNFTNLDFRNPSTPEQAYLLGLLWADGHVARCGTVRLEIVSTDGYDLAETISATGNWRTYYRQRQNWKPLINFSAGNQAFANVLRDFDYHIKSKTAPTKILASLPEKLKPYWFRGYFDGDGCLDINMKHYTYRVIFSAPFDQDWIFLEELCSHLGISGKIKLSINSSGRSSRFTIGGKKNSIPFITYIYQDFTKTIGLSRKRDKAAKLIATSLYGKGEQFYEPISPEAHQ